MQVNLRLLFCVVSKDEVRRACVDLAPKRLTVTFRRCAVRIETAAIHEHAWALAIDGEARIDAGVNDTHAVFGQVEPQRKGSDEFPVMLFESSDDFALKRTKGRRDVPRHLPMSQQPIFVISTNGATGKFADQIDRAGRIRTTHDEIAYGNELIGGTEPDERQQVFEFVPTTVQITYDDRARHGATVFTQSWPAWGSPRCPLR